MWWSEQGDHPVHCEWWPWLWSCASHVSCPLAWGQWGPGHCPSTTPTTKHAHKYINIVISALQQTHLNLNFLFNPFTASCENGMTFSVPGIPASCEKFPHSSQLNFWSTEPIFNQFSVFLKTLNALCVCLQYKHPRSMKIVIRSDKPVTLLLLLWLHKCNIGAEPRSRIIATSAVKGLRSHEPCTVMSGPLPQNVNTAQTHLYMKRNHYI
jgi:hypothetical protein